MKADLHLHSVYSDGIHTPLELAERAKREGLDLICITDHDTLGGDEEKIAAMKACGLPFLRGWEISTVTDRKVHILGYNCKMGPAYSKFLEKRKEEALERTEKMLLLANAFLHVNVTLRDVEEQCCLEGNVLHPIYTARAYKKVLRREGNGIEIFTELFDKGKPAYVTPRRPRPEEAIQIIHELGGVAVLAHPGRMRLEGKEDLLNMLVREGIEGMECHYTTHTVTETESYVAFAHKHNLFVTGGSDFHFDGGRPTFGKPDYTVDENFLAKVMPS